MSQNIGITLSDGVIKQYVSGINALDVARDISEGLARSVFAAEVNGKIQDIMRPITDDATLRLLTWNDTGGKSTFWHSTAHLLAEALEALYPHVKFGIGPPIANGFYYDIDLGSKTLSQEELLELENKMRSLAKEKNEYRRIPISKSDAIQHYQEKGDEYKLELLEDLEDGHITFYQQGGFIDLCRGPHIPHTGHIKAVKILNVAGAYWRGDEKRKQLTRLYGISFPQQKLLNEYLESYEQAKLRDHRKIGKELSLFTFSDKVGKGLPLWLPKGAVLRERLENFMRSAQLKAGYEQVITPHIGSKELYVTSGHYEKYGQSSFQPIHTPAKDEEFLLKPMNCPHHCEIYSFSPRSYKDLPLRYAEFGTVYRYEQSGELHGLTRVRSFTQDDAHIFCRSDQLKIEFAKVIDLVLYVFKVLKFDEFVAQISVRDKQNKDKYIGNESEWNQAEQEIQEVVAEKKLKSVIVEGEAAFYGPKLDFMVKDALDRQWQLGTIQVDYNLPQRFDLVYTGKDNRKHRPVMIHRAPFGSMERFIAILIENTAGNFPLWLAPEQVILLPISENYNKYAQDTLKQFEAHDIRGSVDKRNEKIGKKIREASIGKIPYLLIVGEKESQQESVSVRQHGKGDLGKMKNNDFITFFQTQIKELLT